MLSPASGGERKRRRIAIACNECRDRKRKCDGIKPICGTCAKRAPTTPCVWEEGRNGRGWSHSYVQSLRSRIQHLEQGQATDENNNNTYPRSEQARCSYDGRAVPSTASPQPIARENQDSELPVHEQQSTEQPGLVELISENTNHAPSTNHSWPASTGGGSGDRRASVLTDRHSGMGDDDEAANDEPQIDATGVFGSFRGRDDTQGHDFFGPSSTLHFLSHARRVMSQSTAGRTEDHGQQKSALLSVFQDEGFLVGGGGSPDHPSSLEAPVKPSFSLGGHRLSIPPRAQADALLESYWTYFHSLYPVLHRPSFTERYLTLWAPSSCHNPSSPQDQRRKGFYTTLDERLFHCLLNLTFALGSQFGPAAVDDSDRRELGLIFFKRAKVLIDFDILARGDIFLVQMLILLGHYLQSTDMASACWNMVGLAIRVAQGIGLQHEPGDSEQGKLSQLAIEIQRRAWTSCILLDRVFSMTYGRPLMIHPAMSQDRISPSAIDDEYLSDGPIAPPAIQPPDSPSLTECYIQAIKLQDILGDVLHTLYCGTGDKDSGGDVTFNFMTASTANDKLRRVLLNIDSSLSTWERNLPDYLKARSYNFMGFGANNVFGPRTKAFNRQAIILHARYLHVRLIMFRPVLSALLHSSCKETTSSEQDSSMESAMRQGMLDKGVNLCVASARDLVELITGNLDLCNEALPPSWHNVFYMHSCSIVFLICRLCCLSRIQNKEGLITSWNKCVAFFRTYRFRSRSAKRCQRIVEAIQTRVFSSQPDAKHHPVLGSVPPSDKGPANSTRYPQQTPGGSINYWGDENTPTLQNEEEDPSSSSFLGEAMFPTDQLSAAAAANGISDPSEMNWLSFFPFVEGDGGISEGQFQAQTPPF